MIKKLRLFHRLGLRRKLLLILTLMLSFYSWIMMRFFKQYAHFGEQKSIVNRESNQSLIIADIRWAIFIVNKNVPWQSVCRHQAYQAMLLCKFYNIPCQIFVGFKKNESNKIDGHAWTMVGNEMITGFCNPDEYVVQAVY
jgi:Transglutaminase-like superfamily